MVDSVAPKQKIVRIQHVMYGALFLVILLIAFFDPQNGFGFRRLLIYLLVPLWIYGFFKSVGNISKNYVVFILCYISPIWGILVYMMRGDGMFNLTDTSYISFAFTLSIVHIFNSEISQKALTDASIICGLIFSGFLILTATQLIFQNSYNLINFVVSNDVALISFREYGGIRMPSVYYYASPLLILPISVLLQAIINRVSSPKDHISLIVLLIALFLSGTRAHMVVSIVFLFYYLYQMNGHVRVIAYLILVLAMYESSAYLTDLLVGMFSKTDVSNAYKLSMISLYISLFNDPMTIFIGQGYQAVDWSNELRQMVSIENGATKTELTYIELFRVYGIILPSVIVVIFLHLLYTPKNKNHIFKKIALAGLLFDSALNPHLFSTYGAIMLAVSISPNNESDTLRDETDLINIDKQKPLELQVKIITDKYS